MSVPVVICTISSILIAAIAGVIYRIWSRPLDTAAMEAVAAKRRRRAVAAYFRFSRAQVVADMTFKKAMRPQGAWCQLDYSLYEWPAAAAALLKGKKHEWVIIAFEHGGRISRLWVNKGVDNRNVCVLLGPMALVEECHRAGFSSVFIHHNHPNHDPRHLNMLVASKLDIEFSNEYARAVVPSGINLFQFICERGRYTCFHSRVAESFLPVRTFFDQVHRQNGVSRLDNIRLHLEGLIT